MSIVRLVYISTSLLAHDPNERRQIDDILLTSRRNNDAFKVTGALLATDHGFAQVLEGERDAVEATYARIVRDPRHRDIALILSDSIEARKFPEWAMAYIGPSQSADEAVAHVTNMIPASQSGEAARGLATFMSQMLARQSPARRTPSRWKVIRSWPAKMAQTSSGSAWKPSLAISVHSAATEAASFAASVERSTT